MIKTNSKGGGKSASDELRRESERLRIKAGLIDKLADDVDHGALSEEGDLILRVLLENSRK